MHLKWITNNNKCVYVCVTIKAVTGRRVRFLGIGRRVEVDEKSRDRAVTVIFKSDLLENSIDRFNWQSDCDEKRRTRF